MGHCDRVTPRRLRHTVRYLGVDIEDALESAEHLGFDIVRPRSERGRASVQRPRLRNSTELLCAPIPAVQPAAKSQESCRWRYAG
ncbi:hypothetical protein CN090_07265 [Sinorhizobium meliloti]|nr:hypothetical protein DA101_016895 [Sinorhizobium meliloti]RMI18190.1 hypothetical protein DA102_021570 [Sinorhizobium meliloti]RVG69601.1 hypothetical protein CN222_05705 [Sinorhizobium meliloti]RVG83464.1 hypothetical protein CN221_34790 [Sinorhizobium meliloti]RVG96225.1 hypothetical protein CN218_07250 [Sinorhizobium meliloti]